MRAGRFDERMAWGSLEVSERTLGIVGLGRIGRRTARKAALGLGMNVLAYDPYVDRSTYDGPAVFVDALDEMLSRADVVTLHVPLTDETRHIINADSLAHMRPESYLVNTARGAAVGAGPWSFGERQALSLVVAGLPAPYLKEMFTIIGLGQTFPDGSFRVVPDLPRCGMNSVVDFGTLPVSVCDRALQCIVALAKAADDEDALRERRARVDGRRAQHAVHERREALFTVEQHLRTVAPHPKRDRSALERDVGARLRFCPPPPHEAERGDGGPRALERLIRKLCRHGVNTKTVRVC